MSDSTNPQEIRNILMSLTEPVVLRNMLNWELINWNLSDWERILKDEILQFRCGDNYYTKNPQWERTTSTINTTFANFVASSSDSTISSSSGTSKWMYFDYKYLREHLNNIQELKDNINWKAFGFPDLTSEDSTIWIGSKGAHTPCHQDTYGCNLIAQVYGQKQWTVFPPEENLQPTRIPYEESSIYSKLNFFSPTLTNFKGLSNCRNIILNPGDVLFLPHKWWHYVENLNIAISVNIWLPLPQDNEQRLSESLVQLLMVQICNNLTDDIKDIVLNPNSIQEIEDTTFQKSLELVSACTQTCDQDSKGLVKESSSELFDLNQTLTKYKCIEKIAKLSTEEFNTYLINQISRFKNVTSISGTSGSNDLLRLVNAITHPDVIVLIKDKLLQS